MSSEIESCRDKIGSYKKHTTESYHIIMINLLIRQLRRHDWKGCAEIMPTLIKIYFTNPDVIFKGGLEVLIRQQNTQYSTEFLRRCLEIYNKKYLDTPEFTFHHDKLQIELSLLEFQAGDS